MVLLTKHCNQCKEKKSLAEFSNNKRQSDGKHSQCKICNHVNYIQNKERATELKKRRYDADPEKYREYSREWYDNNKERAYKTARTWVENNRGAVRAMKKRCKVKRSYRMPSWLTEEDQRNIQGFYDMAVRLTECTGIEHHVDHIHPLNGKTVSGLHVPWNLQVLPATQNLKKSNKFNFGSGN